jgi:hypothetical protein
MKGVRFFADDGEESELGAEPHGLTVLCHSAGAQWRPLQMPSFRRSSRSSR